jgi:hypothetical protein
LLSLVRNESLGTATTTTAVTDSYWLQPVPS